MMFLTISISNEKKDRPIAMIRGGLCFLSAKVVDAITLTVGVGGFRGFATLAISMRALRTFFADTMHAFVDELA